MGHKHDVTQCKKRRCDTDRTNTHLDVSVKASGSASRLCCRLQFNMLSFSLSPLQVTHVKMASCPPWCAPPCLPSRPHWAWSSSSRFHWIRPRRSASSRDSTRWVSRASRGPIGRPQLRSLWRTGNVSNVLFSTCYSSPSSSHLNNIHICRRLHLKL